MEDKKDSKGLLIGIIAFVAGVAFIAYGTISLLNSKPEVSDNLDDDSQEIENNLGEMNPVSISDIFGWYFVFQYEHGEGESLSNSKYTYKYTMPVADADTFMRAYLGIPASIVDVTKIDFSKDFFNFTKDDNNYYVEVVATGLDPIQTCVLNDVNIVSDSEIIVTYGVMELGKTCEDKSDSCYTKKRELKLRKSDSGFTILGAADVQENTENPDNQESSNDEGQIVEE